MEEHDPYNNAAGANKGFIARSAHTIHSRTLNMIGGIHSDLFFQDKYILSDVGIRIRLLDTRTRFVSWLLLDQHSK